MALDSIINTGGSVAGKANVDAGFNVKTSPSVVPNYMGGIRMAGTRDDGSVTGNVDVNFVDADDYGRANIGQDIMLDSETYNYTAQNTGKHTYLNTTMTQAWTVGATQTNSGGITTINTGLTGGTYAMWPLWGASTTVIEFEGGFSAAPVTNTTIDFGLFLRGAATPYLPLDGVYFRLTSAGLQGIINYNGTEYQTAVFLASAGGATWTYTPNQKYRFEIDVNESDADFFINGVRYGSLATPAGSGQPFAAASLPVSWRHAIGGTAASGALQFLITDYTVRLAGPNIGRTMGEMGNAVFGSYQGMSGGTMGQLIAGTVTSGTLVKPTAAVPSNTALTANLPNSLGGRIYETLTTGLAANVDGIYASYQVPAGSVSVQGRRLRVTGIKLSGLVSTAVVGGPAFTEWYIAFGHTAASMATAEAAATKAPRRVMLPELTTIMGAAAVAGTLLVQPMYYAKFDNPIYINPGEFIALVGNKTITTAITSGVLAFAYQFDYSSE